MSDAPTPSRPKAPDARSLEIARRYARRQLPPGATPVRLLGVDYTHFFTPDGGELYLTEFGLPFHEHLQIDQWYEPEWFATHRQRLRGTSTVYRLPTRPVRGIHLDLVVKYSRVGEDVPHDATDFLRFAHAEFNSPYEEFALLLELRSLRRPARILTHRPLGIYVPDQRFDLWETGRKTSRMHGKSAKFEDVELDISRQYILVYQWIEGVSADEAFDALAMDETRRGEELAALTRRVAEELRETGYQVIDHKPTHIIVRFDRKGQLLRDRQGRIRYALVDFELLGRIPEHEHKVMAERRTRYLRHQRDRFKQDVAIPLPPHLRAKRILEVDYVFGYAESTQGDLWVVGRDPELFDYFLPERWRHTPSQPLSPSGAAFYTRTKDNVNLVWKLSRMGETPAPPRRLKHADAIRDHGFNSPFEEFEIALALSSRGVPTIYPRAIYRSGLQSERSRLYATDLRRFKRLARLVEHQGKTLLSPTHTFLTLWGFWNGLDELLSHDEHGYCRGVNLSRGVEDGLLERRQARGLMERVADRMAAAGFRDLWPRPTHYLISVRHDGKIILDQEGQPELRVCNFSLIQPTR